MKTLYLSFLIVVGALTSGAFAASDDVKKAAEELEKQFDIKFDSVVTGSDKIDEDKPGSSKEGEITSRAITGTLGVWNGTGRYLYVSKGTYGLNFVGLAAPLILNVMPIYDPSGGTKLWACPYKPTSSKHASTRLGCFYKYLDSTARVSYQWNLP